MKKLMLLLSLLLIGFLLHAQKNFAVRVSDAKTGDGIMNASVKIKSAKKTMVTNASGTVVIRASETDVLQVSRVGYIRREIKMAGQSIAIDIMMEPSVTKKKPAHKNR